MKRLFSTITLLALSINLFAQKVANYSFGKPGTVEYEEFSFWVRDGKRSDIDYNYGKDPKEVKVTFSGNEVLNGSPCFKVKFTNNYILYLTPVGKNIMVTDSLDKYKKSFSWAYEGPVDGIGTFCEPCAENENEAMEILKTYFMK